MARENRTWGYDRIVGALSNLAHRISDQTVGNILRRYKIAPAPERTRKTTCKGIHPVAHGRSRRHRLIHCRGSDVARTRPHYVLFFIAVGSRRVTLAGVTLHPDSCWMEQVARNATMEGTGYLNGCRYLLHDRDTKFCREFRETLAAGGVKCLPLPARSPNLNSYAERWVRSVKDECLSRLILFGESSVRRAVSNFIEHFHHERNHQGKGNLLLFPTGAVPCPTPATAVCCGERLGGLLKYYSRAA
jgi:hypothetical protein